MLIGDFTNVVVWNGLPPFLKENSYFTSNGAGVMKYLALLLKSSKWR